MKWKELIPTIVEVATKKMSLKDEVVRIMCQKEHACMQCLDCGPNAVYCRMCCFKKHDIDRHIIIHPSGGMGAGLFQLL